MIQRKTQSSTYWADYTIASEDLQYLSTLLVEDELPRSTEELSRALVLHRARQEEALIERALSEGTPYRPKQSFEVGERVVFPALGYRAGEVVEVRSGYNPEYDPFKVVRVVFEDPGGDGVDPLQPARTGTVHKISSRKFFILAKAMGS